MLESAPMGQFHSALCQITWTDVRGERPFAVGRDEPVELRFGLRFEPAFWSVPTHLGYFVEFQVFRSNALLHSHPQSGSTLELPGAQSEEQWLGLSFGKGSQVTTNVNGVMLFRPQIFFQRGQAGGEFAVAPEEHYFFMDSFLHFDGWSGTSEELVGGSGRPPP